MLVCELDVGSPVDYCDSNWLDSSAASPCYS